MNNGGRDGKKYNKMTAPIEGVRVDPKKIKWANKPTSSTKKSGKK